MPRTARAAGRVERAIGDLEAENEAGEDTAASNLPFDEWTEIFGSERLHRGSPRPPHPPCPYPGDERGELPPQAEQANQPASTNRLGLRRDFDTHTAAFSGTVSLRPAGTISLRP